MCCRKYFVSAVMLAILSVPALRAEDALNNLRISGNAQLDAQFYGKDTAIGAKDIDEKLRSNGFLNLNISSGSFRGGLRYENYLNPLDGYGEDYKGNGIAFRFFEFTGEEFDVTAGNFYEQFGSGLILRSYEDKALGIDNALDGLRVRYRPAKGVELKGLIGKQRKFWDLSDGIVRGADLNISLTDIFDEFFPSTSQVTFGASVVSRFEQSTDMTLNLPENVLAWSTRLGINGSWYNADAEFAYKYNDPHESNGYSFNPGTGLIVNSSVFGDGIGFSLNMHRIDNMDFRTDRSSSLQTTTLSFVPPLTRQHAYRLTSMYPFSTQLNGEVGLQAEFTYSFPDDSPLGKGASMTLNYSIVKSLDTTSKGNDSLRQYNSKFFSVGDRTYFQDFNIDFAKKWSPKLKTNFTLAFQSYDKDVIGGDDGFGKVNTITAVLEGTYKLTSKNSLRFELQHLFFSQDSTVKKIDNTNGNWAMALLEFTIPNWYFTIFDEYNYGNEFDDKKLHFPSASIAFVHNSFRAQLGYGRQREGVLCVGGVCRVVPSSSGFSLSLSSSF